MTYRLLTGLCLFAAVVAVCVWQLMHTDGRNLPHVLLIGDSVSMGYTPFVQELLQNEAVVIRPMTGQKEAENCQGTNKGLLHIERWLGLGKGRWDAIHFNFGLHDLKRVHPVSGANSSNPRYPRQSNPDRYAAQLEAIVLALKATGAALIFATTTPVPTVGVARGSLDASKQAVVKPYRDARDPPLYNDIARKIMRRHGVSINDLFAFAKPRLKEMQRPADVHFTRDGSRQLAEVVARHIRWAIGQNRGTRGTQ